MCVWWSMHMCKWVYACFSVLENTLIWCSYFANVKKSCHHCKRAVSFVFKSTHHSVIRMRWIHLSSTYWWAFRVFLTFHSYTQSCSGPGLYTFVLVTMMCLLSALNWKHGQGPGLSGRVPTSNAQGPEYPPRYHNTSRTQSQKQNRGIRTWYGSAKPGKAHVYSLLMAIVMQREKRSGES